jgi:tRNA A37 methylthiotransferase MiaB
MEQNQLRIQQLQELQNQIANQAEETQIQELIQALVEQNTALEDKIQAEEQVGSVFGWLLKLFS